MLQKRGHWLLAVFALALYAPTLTNGLTTWDDPDYTTGSPFVTKGAAGALDAFSVAYRGAYIPLSHAVLAVTGAADPANPLPYHLVQWLLFALTVLLLPKALSAFGVERPIALAATALWLAHPFRVESVSWVANLKDTLSLFFVVASFAAYAGERRWPSAVLFVAGLLSKASLAPLAPLFLLLEWRRQRGTPAVVSSLRWLVPSFAAGAAAILVHRAFLPARHAAIEWATPLTTPFWYLERTLMPTGSRAVYEWAPPTGAGLAFLILGWVLVAAIVVLGARKTAAPLLRALSSGTVLFLLPLLPFSGVVPQVHVVAERYTLFPSLVLAVGLAGLLVLLLGRIGVGVVLALTAALAVPNVLRQREWRDALTLWTSNVELAPGSVVARVNLAGALGGAGRFDEAMRELLTVRKLDPAYPGLDCFIAMARAGKEKLDPIFAVTELGELCRLPPSQRWPVAARIVARKDASSMVVLEELAFGTDRAKASASAAALALEKGDHERAFSLATQARLWDPTVERAIVTQVIALLKLKRLEEARALTATEVRDPRVAARLLGLRGAVLNEQGNFAEAEQLLRQSADRLRELGEGP
ncbi:MAG: hypothetical protein JNM69_01745 [Archangium sp.]|nr:hypothetical protein [Archangium sp.]